MSEPSGRELNEKISDIREWLVRIDTKVDYLNDIKKTAERAEEKADSAENIANRASSMAEQNREDIDELEKRTLKSFDDLRSNNQFRFNIMATAIIAMTGFLITIGIAIFT